MTREDCRSSWQRSQVPCLWHLPKLRMRQKPSASSCCYSASPAASILSNANQLLRADRYRPDIMHIHGLWRPHYHQFAKVARQKNIPYVISPHGMLEANALSISKWRKRIAWRLFQWRDLRLSSALHATTSREAETFNLKGLDNRCIIAPPGVHLPKADYRARHTSEKRVLFLGRLHPIKGIDRLVNAWIRVNPAGWRLAVAGPDEAGMRSRLEQQLKTASITTVDWIGPVFGAKKSELYSSTDLLVVPSLSENFCIVVIEALSHGIPVIATHGTPWHSLIDFECGWWVENSEIVLARALVQATSLSRTDLAIMGERGKRLINSTYS